MQTTIKIAFLITSSFVFSLILKTICLFCADTVSVSVNDCLISCATFLGDPSLDKI